MLKVIIYLHFVFVFCLSGERVYRGDPMQFGAYRRWKVPEEEAIKTKGKSRGKKIEKKKDGISSDSFFDAIKKLGSGPAERDSGSKTGVTEPEGGQKPITPKKPIPKKNKKRVITADDIDALFSSKDSSSSSFSSSSAKVDGNEISKSYKDDDEDNDGSGYDEEPDDNYMDDDDNDEVENQEGDTDAERKMASSPFSLATGSTFNGSKKLPGASPLLNELLNPNEETPKWLVDAQKEEKKRKVV